MKKIKNILVIMALMMLVLAGCDTESGFSAKKMAAMMENQESFIVYFGNEECPACVEFEPTVTKINEEYEDIVLYIDTKKDNRDDIMDLIASYNLNLQYTPTVFVIEDGQVIDELVGAVSYDKLESIVKASKAAKNNQDAE